MAPIPLQADFWHWFGDSKVADAHGSPLVVYHQSTEAGFTGFRSWSHFGPIETANAVWPTWKADVYKGTPCRATYPVFLRLRNPLACEENDSTVEADGWAWTAAQRLKTLRVPVPQFPNARNMLPVILAAGYDGIVYTSRGETDGATCWIVLDPTSVRSAIGHTATRLLPHPCHTPNAAPLPIPPARPHASARR